MCRQLCGKEQLATAFLNLDVSASVIVTYKCTLQWNMYDIQ